MLPAYKAPQAFWHRPLHLWPAAVHLPRRRIQHREDKLRFKLFPPTGADASGVRDLPFAISDTTNG
jgi:hypothetical protein